MLLLSISACTSVDNAGSATPFQVALPPTSDASLVEPGLPTQEAKKDDAQMTHSPTSIGMEFLIEKAKEDLAQRLSITIAEISLAKAEEVVWSNASLGCPQTGMAYADVLTPGYLILLEANDAVYEYHTSKGTEVIYCKNPMPPVEGTPLDQ
jgi:hypothetical protein